MNAHPPTKPFFRPSKISFLLLPRNSPIHHVPLPMSPHIAGPEIWRSLTDDKHGIERWEICPEVGTTFSQLQIDRVTGWVNHFPYGGLLLNRLLITISTAQFCSLKLSKPSKNTNPYTLDYQIPNACSQWTRWRLSPISFLIHLSFLTFTWICLRCLGKSKTYSLKWIQMVVQYWFTMLPYHPLKKHKQKPKSLSRNY